MLTATAGLCAGVLVLAGCTSSGADAGTTPSTPSTTSATTSATGTTTGTATDTATQACTAYAGSTGGPRQVVLTASTKPVLGPGVALLAINFRDTVAALDVPTDPQLAAAFAEDVAAIDQLTQQLADGLPEGADATKTPVEVDPTRLAQALDATDGLCSALGVQPKPNTATTADPSASAGPTS